MALVLTRAGSTRVYTSPPSADGWIAYLVWTPLAVMPATLDIATIWSDSALDGYLVFLPRAAADVAAFADALQDSTLLPKPSNASLAWMTYQDASRALGLRQLVSIAAGHPSDLVHVIAADAPMAFANYGVTLHAGTRVTHESTASSESLVFHYPAIDGLPRQMGPEGLRVPLTGAFSGTLQGQGLIRDFSDARDTGWDVACRYYTRDLAGAVQSWRYPVFGAPAPGVQYLFELTWDLFRPLDAARTFLALTRQAFEIVIDANPDRSFVRPVSGDWMPSVFRSRYGRAIELQPRLASETTSPARFVFQPMPDAAGREDRYTLTPSGDFLVRLAPTLDRRVAVPRDTPTQHDWLCGLAGTESIAWDITAERPSTVLRFHPNRPAYAPGYPLFAPVASRSDGTRRAIVRGARRAADGELLTDTYKTSWVSFKAIDGIAAPSYSSQPHAAPLFAPAAPLTLTLSPQAGRGDPTAAASSVPLRENVTLPLVALDETHVFPMVGYGGASASKMSRADRDRVAFEAQILAAVRFDRLSRAAPRDISFASAGADVTEAITPQGLRVKLDRGRWTSVLLAETVAPDGKRSSLAFDAPPAALVSALQASDLFLVISNTRNAGQFANRIVLDGWPFTVQLAAPGEQDTRNILILKYGSGTLKDRAADISAWTQAADFNDDPARLGAWIVSYIQDAELAAPDEPALRDFVRLVNDEHWNGILALRVDVDLRAFPPELTGLLGGMNLTRFFGHHLGVLQNRPGDDKARDSSLFGLIRYRDTNGDPGDASDAAAARAAWDAGLADEPLAPDPAHVDLLWRAVRQAVKEAPDESFDYRVVSLVIAFRNSLIDTFESRLILTVLRFFGVPAQLPETTPPTLFRNSIVFDGSFQRVDGRPSYAFTSHERYQFQTDSDVVSNVEIVSGDFATLQQNDKDTTVRARFQLSGAMRFARLDGLDLFSFGPVPEDQVGGTRGLRFANLTIGMSFAPERPGELRFAIDTSPMTFDTGLSDARPDSVFRRLPLTLDRLLVGQAKRPPKDLGYVPVDTPALGETRSLTEEWYGLVYTLNLGSLGALAARAGFTASLLAAWSPGEKAREEASAVSVFLNLPGLGPGNNGISLQSVLRLNVGSISLDREADTAQVSRYVLALREIALSFLGMSLPKTGVTDLALFGSDSATEGRSSLSWYAAYYVASSTEDLAGDGPHLPEV